AGISLDAAKRSVGQGSEPDGNPAALGGSDLLGARERLYDANEHVAGQFNAGKYAAMNLRASLKNSYGGGYLVVANDCNHRSGGVGVALGVLLPLTSPPSPLSIGWRGGTETRLGRGHSLTPWPPLHRMERGK